MIDNTVWTKRNLLASLSLVICLGISTRIFLTRDELSRHEVLSHESRAGEKDPAFLRPEEEVAEAVVATAALTGSKKGT